MIILLAGHSWRKTYNRSEQDSVRVRVTLERLLLHWGGAKIQSRGRGVRDLVDCCCMPQVALRIEVSSRHITWSRKHLQG